MITNIRPAQPPDSGASRYGAICEKLKATPEEWLAFDVAADEVTNQRNGLRSYMRRYGLKVETKTSVTDGVATIFARLK